MKALLSLFRQFSEVNLRDSRLRDEDNTVWLDAAHGDVFVFLSVNRFEVVGGGSKGKQHGTTASNYRFHRANLNHKGSFQSRNVSWPLRKIQVSVELRKST